MKKSPLSASSVPAVLVFCASLIFAPLGLAQSAPGTPPPPAAPAPPAPPAAPDDMGAPPADAPMDIPPELKLPAPSTTWSAEEKSPASMKKAVEAVHELPAKYSAIPALEETMTISSPQFQGQDQKVRFLAGKNGDAKVMMPGITITRLKDQVYVEMDGRPKYAQIQKDGAAVKAIAEVMGGPLPLPTLIFMGGNPAEAAGALTLGQFPEIVPTGFRAGANGKPDQILLVDPAGTEVVANVDPKTGLVQSLDMSLIQPAFPPGLRLPMTVAFDRRVYDGGFPTPISFDPAGRKMKSSLESLDAAFDAGDPAPDFTFSTTDGGKVSLADLKGKIVVLDFWATWCKPCMMGLPLLDAFSKWAKESGKPIAVYAVDVMERMNADPTKTPAELAAERIKMIAEFWKGKAFSVPTLVDVDDKAPKDFQLTGIPFTMIIGPDGKVVATHLGFDKDAVDNLKKDVEAALGAKAEAAPAAAAK